MKAHLLIAVTAAALALSSTPAPSQTLRQETVALADLNLSTGAGQAQARRRIRVAAARLCAQPQTPLLPRAAAAQRSCRKAAEARAEAALTARSYAAVSD